MRLIDADELIGNVFKNDISYNAFKNLVQRQPTVDAVPVKHGEWIKHSIHENVPWGFDCSICKEWFVVDSKFIGRYKYCPNCGAKMDGEKKEDG